MQPAWQSPTAHTRDFVKHSCVVRADRSLTPLSQITTSCSQLLWDYVKAGKIGDNVATELGAQMRDIQNNFFALYATTEQPVSPLGCASLRVERQLGGTRPGLLLLLKLARE